MRVALAYGECPVWRVVTAAQSSLTKPKWGAGHACSEQTVHVSYIQVVQISKYSEYIGSFVSHCWRKELQNGGK